MLINSKLMKNKEVKAKFSFIPCKYNGRVIKKLNSNISFLMYVKIIKLSHHDKGGELLFLIIAGFTCGLFIQLFIFEDKKLF